VKGTQYNPFDNRLIYDNDEGRHEVRLLAVEPLPLSRRGEWQFLRERAATSLHLISKQAKGAPVILETFKYSSIQVGQEGL
jgi:hypothetical protein